MISDLNISFRPITRADFPLIQKWLAAPHVKEWWHDDLDAEGIEAKYGPRVDGVEPTHVYIILLNENPVGLIQWYLWSDYPAHAVQLGAEITAAGVDLAIGDEEVVGKGLGSQVLKDFVEKIIFEESMATSVVTDPEKQNSRSLRAFEKAGFIALRTVQLQGEKFQRVVVSRQNIELAQARESTGSDRIYLVPYSETWPELAEKEIAAVCEIAPELNFKIDHIGSTAIPGLSAKPIIDLLIGVEQLSDAVRFVEPLEKLGYSYWRGNPKEDHFYFVKGLPLVGGKGRTHHVHIYQKNHDEIKRCLRFRDYLRSHPESLKSYADLKSDLANKFVDDREAYTSGKTDFVNSILKLAEDEPSIEHLSLVQSLWSLHKNPVFHRYLANHVYFSNSKEGDLVVRLTPATHRAKEEVLAEVSFMDYLAKMEFPLAVPISSKNRNLIESIEYDDKLFYATVFRKIEGVRATDEESLEPDFLFNWGAYLAQLHAHSINYGKTENSEHRRPAWDFDAVKIKATSFAESSFRFPSVRLKECLSWLSRLEKSDDDYGLIHGDLHRGNFFVVDKRIVSFDYDDSCFHWFLYDLASSLSTVLKLAQDENERQRIISIFFDGYESIRPISGRWRERFEAFYQYRLSLVFSWMNAMIAEGRFSSATIQNWKTVEPWYLDNMKRSVAFD